jgi:hypothetical protein
MSQWATASTAPNGAKSAGSRKKARQYASTQRRWSADGSPESWLATGARRLRAMVAVSTTSPYS